MTDEEKKQLREEIMAEARALAEKAAKGHDELAAKYPSSNDRIKADAIRRFADVFLR